MVSSKESLPLNDTKDVKIAEAMTITSISVDNDEDDGAITPPTYDDGSTNDLTLVSGALLLMADCLGTGILALPHDVKVLGPPLGIGFIILNLPINWYAGTILSNVARKVEMGDYDKIGAANSRNVANNDDEDDDDDDEIDANLEDAKIHDKARKRRESNGDIHTVDRSTFDFIGLTNALFITSTNGTSSYASTIVISVFYCNIFLVLGNYILVMSHAVRAILGESNICLPNAGIIASTLMFAMAQMRTMAKLGRWATVMSLTALLIVVIQCLIAAQRRDIPLTEEEIMEQNDVGILRKFASLSSIGFAVGSQKLFLNIRHEMRDRNQAPSSLGICLFAFGSAYVIVCILAGDNPPGFLFEAIPKTSILNRRIAGFFLWLHVAVSYAINSQAINSSIDRVAFHRITRFQLSQKPTTRWMVLTLLTSTSSYLVANAVPFFKDLVSLIGALTSVPLTLLLPAILYRKGSLDTNLWTVKSWSDPKDVTSFTLILFSLAFIACGLVGALLSIENDWAHHGPPFACEG